MPDQDIDETFSFLLERIKADQPNIAYAHVTEPRAGGGWDQEKKEQDTINHFHKIWTPKPFIVAGGYTASGALERAEELDNTLVAFGRYFISNVSGEKGGVGSRSWLLTFAAQPDLPYRIKNGIEFTPYDRKTFYLRGPNEPKGYIDYPFASEQSKGKL